VPGLSHLPEMPPSIRVAFAPSLFFIAALLGELPLALCASLSPLLDEQGVGRDEGSQDPAACRPSAAYQVQAIGVEGLPAIAKS